MWKDLETHSTSSYMDLLVMTAQSCTPEHLALTEKTLKKTPEKHFHLIFCVTKLLPGHNLHCNKLFILSSAVQANCAAGTRNTLEQEKQLGDGASSWPMSVSKNTN